MLFCYCSGPQQGSGTAEPARAEATKAGEGPDTHLGKDGAARQASSQAQERGAQGAFGFLRQGCRRLPRPKQHPRCQKKCQNLPRY